MWFVFVKYEDKIVIAWVKYWIRIIWLLEQCTASVKIGLKPLEAGQLLSTHYYNFSLLYLFLYVWDWFTAIIIHTSFIWLLYLKRMRIGITKRNSSNE